MKQNVVLSAFNRGIVSPKALARIDMERLRLSAETQNNWVPRSLGSMTLRPGMEYITSSLGNAASRVIPFVYSATDTAWIELTDSVMRPIVNDAAITRPSVSTVVTNGDFSSGTGWTVTATGGSSGAISGGKLTIECVAVNSYVVTSRTVMVAGGDQNVEHAFKIVVDSGPVTFRAGHSSGADDLVSEASLGRGVHSLAFTPTSGTVYIEFESRLPRNIVVDSVTIEAAGAVTLATPWTASDLSLVRWEQSGNVVYVACFGYQQRKIVRRATRSWSITYYEPEDGPFRGISTDDTLKLSINKARGNGTLTASRPVFKSGHVGALFRAFTPGYNFSYNLAQADAFTPAIRINGVGDARNIQVVITGTWAGTLTLQKSFIDEQSGFADTASTYTANTTASVTDTADNTAIWYRIGFKAGAYTSGTATVTLVFGNGGGGQFVTSRATSPGGGSGICRVKTVTSSTSAEVEILKDFTSPEKTEFWYEGQWSEHRGWPSAVSFHEGRLFFAGADDIVGSVPDAYESFSLDVEGDSGVIQRSIGYGPVQIINFLLGLTRLLVGGEASEVSVRSSTFDEPLTPTNFTLKDISTFGSARSAAVKVDNSAVFVDRSKIRILEAAYSVDVQDYVTNELTQIAPELNERNPVVKIFVQRRPDTRIHFVRDDGTVAVLLYEKRENVMAWYTVSTDGEIEDGWILPGDYEDQVYYTVKRTINGSTVRYYEKWAREDECYGETMNKQADSFYEYSGASTTTITGLSHLEGESVVVWGNGKDLGTYTVSGGQITGVSEAVTSAIVGLTYQARFKSAKLAYAAGMGTALGQRKRVNKLSLLLHKTHHDGVYAGRDFDNLRKLPQHVDGQDVTAGTIHESLDVDMSEFAGDWNTDSRICIEANAPRPVTVMAAVFSIVTNDT